MIQLLQSKTLDIIKKDGLTYIQFPRLAACGAVKHIFSTRMGGVSKSIYGPMNLSFNRGDSRENVLENYKILCGAVGIDINKLVLTHQTHTANVRAVTEEDCGTGIFKEPFSDVDGLITDRPGVALVTQYADCTPLVFCDPVRRVAATSHAGWRGTVQEIGAATVKKMIDEFGCRAENIIAGIGPCIGKCCYEVDDPVINGFKKLDYINISDIAEEKSGGKYMLDLVTANKLILIHAGIDPNNIDASDICTCCNSRELHSHRASPLKRGNLAAIIALI